MNLSGHLCFVLSLLLLLPILLVQAENLREHHPTIIKEAPVASSTATTTTTTATTSTTTTTTTTLIDWSNVTAVSKTVATLQVVSNPILNTKTSPVAPQLFDHLKALQADLVRYVPWFPYPLVAVAELEPPNPRTRTTSWKFSEEMQQQFLDTFHAVVQPTDDDTIHATSLPTTAATTTITIDTPKKKRIIINFSTQPKWMFNNTDWSYEKDPNQADWKYARGAWINTTTQLVADYYGRLASWLIQGHFVDEFGNVIQGGPALGDLVTHWEVFNEPDMEHSLSWQQYNIMYDAVVQAIRKAADPHHRIQFVGMALGRHNQLDRYRGFLNGTNHAPDVRDAVANGMVSFHWYSPVSSRTNVSTFVEPFGKMEAFFQEVNAIIAIRDSLSPTTGLAVNEAGVIPHDDNSMTAEPLPPIYYNMVAAVYTVLVSRLSVVGVDLVGSSQFCGCPAIPLWHIPNPQYPGVSMTNWTTGNGNPRYWALKLFLQYFGPGDKIVDTTSSSGTLFPTNASPSASNNAVFIQARITKDNKYAIIVVNKTPQQQSVKLSHLVGAQIHVVDETTHDGPWKTFTAKSESLELLPFAVAVVHLTNNIEMPSYD